MPRSFIKNMSFPACTATRWPRQFFFSLFLSVSRRGKYLITFGGASKPLLAPPAAFDRSFCVIMAFREGSTPFRSRRTKWAECLSLL